MFRQKWIYNPTEMGTLSQYCGFGSEKCYLVRGRLILQIVSETSCA
jgi:hypothetical protein